MQRKKTEFSQSAVEFALVLPLLLLVIFGMIEMGRLVFVYTTVLNASREAARYGAATGKVTVGGVDIEQYKDCAGIRNAARRVGFLQNFQDSDIQINYDQGPTTSNAMTCESATASPSQWGTIQTGSRIIITVTAQYSPIVPLVPLQPFTVKSTNARTLLSSVSIEGTAPPWPTPNFPTSTLTTTPTPSSTVTPTRTSTPTSTSTSTPTSTPTQTWTASPTWLYTPTITRTPTISATPTKTGTPTITGTPTQTPTPNSWTSTPTATATQTPACGDLSKVYLPAVTSDSGNTRTTTWSVRLVNNGYNPFTITKFVLHWPSVNINYAPTDLSSISYVVTGGNVNTPYDLNQFSIIYYGTLNGYDMRQDTYDPLLVNPATPTPPPFYYQVPIKSGTTAGVIEFTFIFTSKKQDAVAVDSTHVLYDVTFNVAGCNGY